MAVIIYAFLQLKKWKKNIRVILAFLILFLLCITMTEEYVSYSRDMDLAIQLFEPFILMFTQRYALIFLTLIFLLLYQDVPFIDESSAYQLIRGSRSTWVLGQLLYILLSTFVFLLFALVTCMLFGMTMSFTANMWSETAKFTAYGGAVEQSAPIPLRLIQNTTPIEAVLSVFLLFFLGALALNTILFAMNLRKKKFLGLAVIAGLIFIGYLITTDILLKEWSGWISIIVHTNLSMHRFGEEGTLPRIWESAAVLGAVALVFGFWSWRLSKTYNFFEPEENS